MDHSDKYSKIIDSNKAVTIQLQKFEEFNKLVSLLDVPVLLQALEDDIETLNKSSFMAQNKEQARAIEQGKASLQRTKKVAKKIEVFLNDIRSINNDDRTFNLN